MTKHLSAPVPVPFMACRPVLLDRGIRNAAAYQAIEINPLNAPANHARMHPDMIGVLTTKYWGARARDITVGFMEPTTTAIRDMILSYANLWGAFTNVRFRWSRTAPMVRISFAKGGYYSYEGTDILSIPADQLTMNLEGFDRPMPDSEKMRVIPHEFGHTLGSPHEHSRQEIIDLLDRAKVIASFEASQGWSEQEIIDQILTPAPEGSFVGASPHADQQSIMCYQFDGSVTKSGQPILGGGTFSQTDKIYMGKIYPPDPVTNPNPPPTPPPTVAGQILTLVGLDATGKEVARFK